jgi:hypothetical protein
MGFLCLRVDLDYVPWDSPDAHEFGHGEPAAMLRLLELARHLGIRLHAFASNRVMRAFPALPEVLLGEGHDLDWFCKKPEEAEARFEQALELMGDFGTSPVGMCLRSPWPGDALPPRLAEVIRFVSTPGTQSLASVRCFPVETRTDREAIRGGLSARAWTDASKAAVRDAAARGRELTLVVRPQVLAKFDPKLAHLREVLEMARAVDLPYRTLRQALQP